MLEIIRSGNTKWPFVSEAEFKAESKALQAEKGEIGEEPLLRAPGIPKTMGDLVIKPVVRATTVPNEITGKRGSMDFEPFNRPSLFSGFKRSATMVENSRSAALQPSHSSLAEQQRGLPICGNPTIDTTHLYMSWQSCGDIPSSSPSSSTPPKPKCTNCTVLMQSMDRLRQVHSMKASLESKSSPPPTKPEPAATRPSPALASVDEGRERIMKGQIPLPRPVAQPVNGVSFGPHYGVEKEARDTANANIMTAPTYTTHHTGLTNPLAPVALAQTAREPERIVSAQRAGFPAQPFIHTTPRQYRAAAPAPDSQSTQPASRTLATHPSIPSRSTVFPSTVQAPRHQVADLKSVRPASQHEVSSRVPSSNPYRQPVTVRPTSTSRTPSAFRSPPRGSPMGTSSNKHHRARRPEDAALWAQLQELQRGMEGLLKEKEDRKGRR
jgi:hypothetical protein